MVVYQMSVMPKHGVINGRFESVLTIKYGKAVLQRLKMYGEGNVRLAYGGDFQSGAYLFDVNTISEEQIAEFDYIMPDIFLFDQQPFKTSKSGITTAGFPDLIIEIWSDGNKLSRRKELHSLYMTSPVSEVWYLNQENTLIERWYKQRQLPNLDFRELIQTQNGLEFDLRDLAD